jgi:hypothetical protein
MAAWAGLRRNHGNFAQEMLSTYIDLTGCPSIRRVGRWDLADGISTGGDKPCSPLLRSARATSAGYRTDYHWDERFDNFRWGAAFFPDPAHLSERLRALGVRLGLIFTPFLNMRHGRLKKRIFNLQNSVPRAVMNERELQAHAACSATGRRSRIGARCRKPRAALARRLRSMLGCEWSIVGPRRDPGTL